MVAGDGTARDLKVSFVVIARNEAEHIEKCLTAAVRASTTVESEVVFVDCGSTDATLAVAQTFPVKVVRMSPNGVLSAAAARRVGTLSSKGVFIIFLDGDCVLEPEWVALAVAEAEANPRLGGVTGRVDEVYVERGCVVGARRDAFGTGTERCWMPSLGGNALYRRSALDQAGGFNPFIKSWEEGEVCYRMRKRGYEFVCLPERVVTHHTEKRETFGEGWLRFRKGLYTGFGQVFRSALRHGFLLMYVRTENRAFLVLGSMVLGLLAAVYGVAAKDVRWFAAWLGLMAAGFLYVASKNRSILRPAYFLTQWLLQCLSLILYAPRSLPEAETWIPAFEVLKDPDSASRILCAEGGHAQRT